MFDVEFEHYLTYGATDQQTVRRLPGQFTGLMIPGTVAAFQREGTGGFALTLSATEAQTPYVIDPRFPLFQQPHLCAEEVSRGSGCDPGETRPRFATRTLSREVQ